MIYNIHSFLFQIPCLTSFPSQHLPSLPNTSLYSCLPSLCYFCLLSCCSARGKCSICPKPINTCHFAAAVVPPRQGWQGGREAACPVRFFMCHGVLQIISTSDFKRKTREIAAATRATKRFGWLLLLHSTKHKITEQANGQHNGTQGETSQGEGERKSMLLCACLLLLLLHSPWPLMAFLCKLLSAFFVAAKQKAAQQFSQFRPNGSQHITYTLPRPSAYCLVSCSMTTTTTTRRRSHQWCSGDICMNIKSSCTAICDFASDIKRGTAHDWPPSPLLLRRRLRGRIEASP